MSESSESKNTRRFLNVATSYRWEYQTSIFFTEADASKDISEILPTLKRHITYNNPNIPILLRIQHHVKNNKKSSVLYKKENQLFITLYSPTPLKLPIFHKNVGMLELKDGNQYLFNKMVRSLESRLSGILRKIKEGKVSLRVINSFTNSKQELKSFTILNSKHLSLYKREIPLQF